MKNNKLLGILLWAVGLIVSLLLLFLIPDELNGTVWAVVICTLLVYGGHLALWLALQKRTLEFLNFSALATSVGSLVVQTLWALIAALAANVISTKVAILVNVLLILGQIAVTAMALMAKNTIEKTHSRQKDHHTEL